MNEHNFTFCHWCNHVMHCRKCSIDHEFEEVAAQCKRWQDVAWIAYHVINNKWERTQFDQAYEEALSAEPRGHCE